MAVPESSIDSLVEMANANRHSMETAVMTGGQYSVDKKGIRLSARSKPEPNRAGAIMVPIRIRPKKVAK